MTFSFRPATREGVGLLIGIAGGTGSGKTYSAMRLAKGISGDRPFAVIDTEAGRAKHYADEFRFDHGDLKPPFRPDAYAEAIRAADDAGYPVIVVDSASHEHAGEGGLLDWQEEELTRMAGEDWKRREACKMAAWIKPKTSHKHFVSRLLQVRAHLILCFRAEEKVEMVRGDDGKMKIVPKQSRAGRDGWIPICEKNLPFEMTVSFLLLVDRPGYPNPIKLEEQHKPLFPLDHPINEDSGRAIAVWAHGGKEPSAGKPEPTRANDGLDPLRADGEIAAREGMKSLRIWFGDLNTNQKRSIENYKNEVLKPMAADADRMSAAPTHDELQQEYLPAQITVLADMTNAELDAHDQKVRAALAGHDDIITEWSGHVSARKRELATPTAATTNQPADASADQPEF
jgi:hypothetical protein